MTVADLIEQLKRMPSDAGVYHLWDGALRTEINYVWLARNGVVGTADYQQVCYDANERPADAPTEEQDQYWDTPSEPQSEIGRLRMALGARVAECTRLEKLCAETARTFMTAGRQLERAASEERDGTAHEPDASLPVVPWNDGWVIRPTNEAADAFWKYWKENGETHRHGYYESTWGAINQALRASTSKR